MVALAEEGHTSPFQQQHLAQLSHHETDRLIGDTSFHEAKAAQTEHR